MPPDTPVTIPEVGPTVATVDGEALQLPPALTSVIVILDPWQTVDGPAIGDGVGLTVIVLVRLQPVGSV